ncbi:putative holin-like toxin [Listeria fleischmannii]|uniref:Putative holin-like toxin n=1 Tax=Listeria fleischmannii TaxID=1069827 RepID=A0A841YID4_9LIST|nr:putative holin-like toxin [Listeria fleischmannii]EIA19338.1 hypothetical protein KKC_12910 [Listeria fleischmannii subsp. coloradonensis]MBC1399808.1 putative holin-like toxin [Listeria fleischmannii]MBC1428117.1 putative holin-like toxin [Listeria fleischmannii]
MSIAEAMQLMLGFGSLLISLVSLFIASLKLKNDQKK